MTNSISYLSPFYSYDLFLCIFAQLEHKIIHENKYKFEDTITIILIPHSTCKTRITHTFNSCNYNISLYDEILFQTTMKSVNKIQT